MVRPKTSLFHPVLARLFIKALNRRQEIPRSVLESLDSYFGKKGLISKLLTT